MTVPDFPASAEELSGAVPSRSIPRNAPPNVHALNVHYGIHMYSCHISDFQSDRLRYLPHMFAPRRGLVQERQGVRARGRQLRVHVEGVAEQAHLSTGHRREDPGPDSSRRSPLARENAMHGDVKISRDWRSTQNAKTLRMVTGNLSRQGGREPCTRRYKSKV